LVRGGDRRDDAVPAVLQRIAGEIERGEQQRTLARRLLELECAVHERLESVGECTVAQVEHGRLGEAAAELVRARDDEVGALPKGILREIFMETEMSAPRSVDDERSSCLMSDLRKRRDIRDGTEVARRDQV